MLLLDVVPKTHKTNPNRIAKFTHITKREITMAPSDASVLEYEHDKVGKNIHQRRSIMVAEGPAQQPLMARDKD